MGSSARQAQLRSPRGLHGVRLPRDSGWPRLIEVNTNAGGAFLNALFAPVLVL